MPEWYKLLILVVRLNLLHIIAGTEITSQVFGTDTLILPAAFGDFNSDELTDLFVLRNKSKTIEILLGFNEAGPLLKATGLKCTFNECDITGVVPGDFDGDALMDVLVTTKCPRAETSYRDVHVLWGGLNKLNCSFDEKKPIIQIRGEPLAIDYNHDFIIDLFGVSTSGQKGLWMFKSNRTEPSFEIFDPDDKHRYKIREPHSNAYLDLNNDNVADLFLTVQTAESYYFEEWHGYRQIPKFTFYSRTRSPPYARTKLGQSLFLDLELEGKMDHVVPVLDKTNPKILVYSNGNWHDLNVNFKNDGATWSFLETGLPYSKAVTVRGGDYNMDGYPDLLATLVSGKLRRAYLFENVPCATKNGCGNFTRSFQIKWNGFANSINDSVSGVFYDIFQDGILDAILIRQYPNESYYVSAFKNNLDYDANFIKVMVLTGLDNKNFSKTTSALGKRKNAFGTNLPGPRVSYKTVDQDGILRVGVSSQLAQSAHYSLNLPYIMFALGRTPNFVDSITVGFASHHRDLPQVIPNSQMVVIPVRIDHPSKWKVQLFVTPSKIILLSGMALIGTCFFIVVIILILHWKEKKMDRRERLQEAYRFNFDAM